MFSLPTLCKDALSVLCSAPNVAVVGSACYNKSSQPDVLHQRALGFQPVVGAAQATLFPAGDLVAKKDSDAAFSLASLPQEQLYLALNARCSRTASRSVGKLLNSPSIACCGLCCHTSVQACILITAFQQIGPPISAHRLCSPGSPAMQVTLCTVCVRAGCAEPGGGPDGA